MLGPHINRYTDQLASLLPRWQPAIAITLHQSPADNIGQRIKDLTPDTIVIGRLYRDDGWYTENIMRDPITTAEVMAGWVRTAADHNPGVDYWQTNNEVCQQTPEQLGRLSMYTIRLCQLVAPLRIAGGCFSTGQPATWADDGGQAWRTFAPALQVLKDQGGVLLLHEYWGGPAHYMVDRADHWHIGRYQYRVRPHLPENVRDVQFAIGETGCDYGVLEAGARLGWRSRYGGDEALYAAHLLDYAMELADWSNCLGAAIFQVGETGGTWSDFAIDGNLLQQLAVADDASSGETETSGVEIYDRLGNRRDEAWLAETYGTRVLSAPVAPGQQKFRLVRVEETEGPAVIVVRVLNLAGEPHIYQPVANSWPDDRLTDLSGAGLVTLWQRHAIVQEVDANGYTGFGLGTGSYIKDVTEGGPHTIWVLSPSLASDGLTGVGMLGGTNHRGPLSMVFQIGADDFATLDEAIIRIAKSNQRMSHNFDAAIQRKALENGHWLIGDEKDVIWQGKWRGVTQLAVNPATGQEYAYFATNVDGEWTVELRAF